MALSTLSLSLSAPSLFIWDWGSMGGGIRSNVKRYTVKRVTLDADTADETINSNLSLPEPAQEKLAWGCSCQVIVQTGTTAQLKDDMYSRNNTLSSNLDSGNLTGLFCHLSLSRGRKNPTQVCLRPGDSGDKKPQDQSSLPETSMASYGTSFSNGKLPCLNMFSSAAKEECQLSKNDPVCTAMNPAILDHIITRLLEVRSKPGKQVELNESEVRQLCLCSREIFLKQPNLLELEAPISICGNIHGQYSDLLRLFKLGGSPPSINYLFLGGYVDYGKQSLETICLLLSYKIKYPENFFLLRGNDECASVNRIYGFYDECKRRFNVRLWKCFTDTFNCLPVAALIDDKIFCVHGGLSPDLTNLDQIRNLQRPTEVPDSGLMCDLLWSDPGRDVRGWGMNDRGVSYTFGPDRVADFLMKHDLDLICRAHQVVEDGYEFSADRQLVTIFSAPNFCGGYDNAGAIMRVDENLMCSFQVHKPAEKKAKFKQSTKI